MKWAVIVFPGSNCDHDCYYILKDVLGQDVCYKWHKDTSLSGIDCVVLPGGFSYGDYLRCGAIARFSPIMNEVIKFANNGGRVIGICNGFQILLEAGLLPGAMLRNESLRFICRNVYLRIENSKTVFTKGTQTGQILRMPIAHAEGNYFADNDTLNKLHENNQIVFRYCTPEGVVVPDANPNGAIDSIAGICNENGNVLGIMPHPERVTEQILGGVDGRLIFESIINRQ
ncbi:phosphoribosylformylglycinamidine synthase subunit PurQ [bacterium]|nr:phosphoribosylformylglycinamidine synthase subunit PurQ [bacterium]MBU1752453.1 phosphoribosylformylglycinamidine synthase subunit PurQ [bacterium]